ncbi:orotidine-5'-phosphate decarboxylase [Williamsia sp. MIQD14]|uniref:orotidine-5'-phosphate decarboxylase n=1 Tax=Williamsia sp. MIQD14 TaxID=3425703 RepID=UPI003DA02AAF
MTDAGGRTADGGGVDGGGLDYAARHLDAVARRGRLCVGVDPHPALLTAWGLGDDVDGLRAFTETVVRAVAPVAAAIKPQVALFERFGSAGFAVLEEAIGAIAAAGALVIADAKRGDIGSTMAAYASAWLSSGSPLCSDAVTVSPYLGVGSLDPAFGDAAGSGRGVFVLARTSNPEGASVQLADLDGTTVAQSVIDAVAARNAAGPASLGVVVGATRPHGLTLEAIGGPILAPGVGAQGGTPADVARIFDGAHRWVLPAVSREILGAGPDRTSLVSATEAMRDAVESALHS